MARPPRKQSLDGRPLSVRVKSAKGRKNSSTRWLQRQLNDPYVAAAGREGYRSRAAFKLLEIDDKHHILKAGQRVLDLGGAPGGWAQVAVERAGGSGGTVVTVDRDEMEEVDGALFLRLDFEDPAAPETLRDALGGPADVILSDMAPNFSGHSTTDKLRTAALVELTVEYAGEALAPGGALVAKVFHGGTDATLLAEIKRQFASVRHVKPPASRADSAEIYLVAHGFRGDTKVGG